MARFRHELTLWTSPWWRRWRHINSTATRDPWGDQVLVPPASLAITLDGERVVTNVLGARLHLDPVRPSCDVTQPVSCESLAGVSLQDTMHRQHDTHRLWLSQHPAAGRARW
eukprot:1810006-Prymnesium_polylepis.3